MTVSTKRPDVPLNVARAVLHSRLVGDPNLGVDGGDFARRLIEVILVADKANLAKLQTLFPDWVVAVEAVRQDVDGIDWLRGLVLAVAA